MASLFANELADAGVIEQVLVVVPNDPLREQMRQNFHDSERGLNRYLTSATKQRVLPGLGTPFGKVVTYQSLSNQTKAKRLANWCAKRATLVIFDECHHLNENKAWERGSRILVERAKLVLCMSGTLWRWDKERIPFVNYDDQNIALVDIRYSRAEALSEKAVLPVELKFFDGEAIYEHRNVPHKTRLSSAPLNEQARSLKTCLQSEEYSTRFLLHSVKDWEHYRKVAYPSQLIVVCHSQSAARRAHKFIQHHFGTHNPVLSVCSIATADKAIKQFRAGQSGILTTVKKAYEGLDVPGASHLVYLGDIRSWPFLDQVIARVTRFNPAAPLDWSEQRGYVSASDDKMMRSYVDNMLEQQAEYFQERPVPVGGERAAHVKSTFRPDTASVTEINFGLDGRCLTKEENIGIRALEERFPRLQAPLSDRLEIAEKMGLVPLAPGEPKKAS
jgi:superfamily II DNA or RNA helicase